MIKVRHSFDELRVGDTITVKNWHYAPRLIEKLPGNCLRVQGSGPKQSISYDQYDYTVCDDWPHGNGIRFIAVRLPLDKLTVGMQVASKGNHGSMPIKWVKDDQICLDNLLRDTEFFISYEHDYNYSLLRPQDAADLVEDPFQALALRILGGDPQATDAARDVLKC